MLNNRTQILKHLAIVIQQLEKLSTETDKKQFQQHLTIAKQAWGNMFVYRKALPQHMSDFMTHILTCLGQVSIKSGQSLNELREILNIYKICIRYTKEDIEKLIERLEKAKFDLAHAITADVPKEEYDKIHKELWGEQSPND